jgi:hypothetical protein
MSDKTEKHVGYNYFIQAANSRLVIDEMTQRSPLWQLLMQYGNGDPIVTQDDYVIHVIDLKDGQEFPKLRLIDETIDND